MDIKSSVFTYKLEFTDNFESDLEKKYKDGDFIIADREVINLFSNKILTSTRKDRIIEVSATEEQKSYIQIAPIIEQLIEKDFRKNNKLIALGGGITQDITAFIASIMYRGVDWLFFPTTLLAQCDSCIGSKTSINFGKYKNQIGNFYPPKEIFIDANFLKTLEEKDIASGMGEMAHYFIVSSENDFQRFKSDYLNAKSNYNILKELIIHSLEIKKAYIEIDEFDKKERQLFNYGHSFGHAIESLTNYKIPHGVAVSIGMDISNFISTKFNYLDKSKRNEMRSLLEQIWWGYDIKNINLADFEDALKKDKKNEGDLIGLILSKGPGQTFKVLIKLDIKFSNLLKEYFASEFKGR